MEEGNIPLTGVDIYTPDFTAIGSAFGCETALVKTLDELKCALTLANKRHVPTLIEIQHSDFVDGYPMP